MKRVVFTDSELEMLTECPEVLKTVAEWRKDEAEYARAHSTAEIAEAHARRASVIEKIAQDLDKAMDEVSVHDEIYPSVLNQPMTMDLPKISDFIEELMTLYTDKDIGFDAGYTMACSRILEFVRASRHQKFKEAHRLVYHSRVADLIHLAGKLTEFIQLEPDVEKELSACIEYLRSHIPQTLDETACNAQLKAPDGTVLMEVTSQQKGEYVEPFLPQSLKLTDSTGRTVEMFPAGSQIPSGWRLVPNVISEEWTARYIDSLHEDQQPVGTFKSTVKVLARMLKTAPIYKQ
jgi:cellobiose-specific phosphotransferase system component IIA/uncharacterized protein YbdZ (MbtH family)